jgi:hypothetical protein
MIPLLYLIALILIGNGWIFTGIVLLIIAANVKEN